MAESGKVDAALRGAIGAEPPAPVAELGATEQRALAALIADSRQRQQQQLQKALEDALGYLPRLLRAPVRRVLFPKRGGGK